MRRTNLENWIEKIEKIPNLTREALEALQLQRLNHLQIRLLLKSLFLFGCLCFFLLLGFGFNGLIRFLYRTVIRYDNRHIMPPFLK